MISIIKENSIEHEMIPKKPSSGCPDGTFDGASTCYCEDHCSWESCRLVFPPKSCWSSSQGEKIWAWNQVNNAWTAQG